MTQTVRTNDDSAGLCWHPVGAAVVRFVLATVLVYGSFYISSPSHPYFS